MPLLPGKNNVGKNIETEIKAGKPRKQAIAIAMNFGKKGINKKGTNQHKRKMKMSTSDGFMYMNHE